MRCWATSHCQLHKDNAWSTTIFLWGIMSPVNINLIWLSCNLVDAAQKKKIFVCSWPVADSQFGSTDSNGRLDVAQFLRFCKCCSELFYERRRNYSVMKIWGLIHSLPLLQFPQTHSAFIHAVFCCYTLLKLKTILSISSLNLYAIFSLWHNSTRTNHKCA